MHGPTCVRDASFNPLRSQITSRKRKYGCEKDERMFIFANTSTQGIISFNTRIGEWEYNGDIVGGPGSNFAVLNGLFLSGTRIPGLHVMIQLFSNLEKIYTIGRQDNPREVHTLDMRTGERSTVCPRAEKHTDITVCVVRGKIFTCGCDRDICELYDPDLDS